jgi:hypothetical protein
MRALHVEFAGPVAGAQHLLVELADGVLGTSSMNAQFAAICR